MILITGSGGDTGLADYIIGQDGIKAGNIVSVCAKATLKQAAALFKMADLVISGDSGPLHIAISAGAKAIGLFGPTSSFITGPYKADSKKVIILHKDIGCKIPCYNLKCGDYKCMSAITVDEAFELVKKLL